MASLAGCGGGKKAAPPTTPATKAIRVYFLRQGKVQPVRRTVSSTNLVRAALAELVAGPTQAERSTLGVTSVIQEVEGIKVAGTVVRLPGFDRKSLAQVVYTVTQFPTVTKVEMDGRSLTRKDFEAETPQILVESPLPFQKITSPLHASGTANTFEATFQYELRDLDGKVVAKHFVTATSGTGTRGTFDFTAPFSFHHPGMGALVVYELSAEDGSRIHQVEIPVELTR